MNNFIRYIEEMADVMISRNGENGAAFSECYEYRYALWRRWDEGKPTVMFIMLNPSTADAESDDPTIRKCRRYAESWGYGSLLVGNLFAWRATDPDDLRAACVAGENTIGPGNDETLRVMARESKKVVVAWGNDGSMCGRSTQMREKIADLGSLGLYALHINMTGEPRHPLYVRRDLSCSELIPEACWEDSVRL